MCSKNNNKKGPYRSGRLVGAQASESNGSELPRQGSEGGGEGVRRNPRSKGGVERPMWVKQTHRRQSRHGSKGLGIVSQNSPADSHFRKQRHRKASCPGSRSENEQPDSTQNLAPKSVTSHSTASRERESWVRSE